MLDTTIIHSSIANLDLTLVKRKLLSEGVFHDNQEFVEAEEEYKLFLQLCKIYPEESLGISEKADKFWHYHILDTRKYMQDCDIIFGHYLHHNPNLLEGSSELYEVACNTAKIKKIPMKLADYVGCNRL